MPIFHSTDGERWQELPAATGAPSGLTDVVFAGGWFFALSTTYFIDQASSVDGVIWQPLPGLQPGAGLGEYVVGSSAGSGLALWSPGQTPQPLDTVRHIETLSDAERTTRMRWNGSVEPREFTPDNFPGGVPLPEQIEFTTWNGADCTSSRCVIVHDRLYLVSTAL